MSEWKPLTPRERADIRFQAILKEVIAQAPVDHLAGDRTIEWIDQIFNGVIDIHEKRLNKDYPEAPFTPYQTASGQHLSDEKVAQSLRPPFTSNPPQTDNLNMIMGNVEATSSKKLESGKYMYGIKLLGDWYTSFWKSHFDAAESAKVGGHPIKMLCETKPYKDKKTGEMKIGKNVQSVELA